MDAQKPDFVKALKNNAFFTIIVVGLLIIGFLFIRPLSVDKANNTNKKAAVANVQLPSDNPKPEELEFTFPAMGKIPVTIKATGIEEKRFEDTCTSVKNKLKIYEDMLSTYKEDSMLSKINRGEYNDELPEEVMLLFQACLDAGKETDGLFDVTVGPLVAMWKKAAKDKVLPTDDEKKAAFKYVGYQKVKIDNRKIILEPGVQIDLGGIAKGWMADIIVKELQEAGATRCIGQVGGDITMWDANPKATFDVGIKNPLEPDKVLTSLQMPPCAMETSGDYYRFYEIDGKKYNHIFDPRTGEPVDTMLSVTLFGPNGTKVDPLGTALYVMGVQKAMEFLAQYPELDAIFIENSGDPNEKFKITFTPNLAKKLAVE